MGCFWCLEIIVGSTSLKRMAFQIACVHTHLGDLYAGYLDEAEYDVKNYVGRGECYLQRPTILLPTPALFLKLPVQKPDPIIVLILIQNLTKKFGKCYLDAKVRSTKYFSSYFSAVSGYEGLFILADFCRQRYFCLFLL